MTQNGLVNRAPYIIGWLVKFFVQNNDAHSGPGNVILSILETCYTEGNIQSKKDFDNCKS